MATVLRDPVDTRRDVDLLGDERVVPHRRVATRRSRRVIVVGVVLLGLLAAFAVHLAAYRAWVVDDSGISIAYAVNLVNGHGLVAQPGAAPVEAFSNPLWVGVLAGSDVVGLLGRPNLFGLPGYVVVIKGLAVLLHAAVLVCVAVVIHRVLTATRGRPPGFGLFLAAWAGTGLLLAANPSYVIWMGSGLENPFFAALVAGIAALATAAMPRPNRAAMLGLGLLAGLAALTRPDGLVYVGVLVVVAVLADASGRQRWALAASGLLVCVAVFGAYLAFRRAYFGAWLPNTAVAKDQGLPSLGDVARVETILRAYGWPLFVVAVLGTGVASMRAWRARNRTALRVVAVGLAVLGAGIATFVVLPTDWMRELRFLTPVWPLLSAAAVLGVVQLAAVVSSRPVRITAVVVLVAFGATVVPGWRTRAESFRAEPTLPLCFVADRYGTHFDAVVRALGRDPRTTAVLLPDIGGVLLASEVQVVDLAGLADVRLARLIADGADDEIADHVLTDLRPTAVHLHGDWVARSGLLDDARFRAAYMAILGEEDWVRADAIEATADPDATLTALRNRAARLRTADALGSCASTLFG